MLRIIPVRERISERFPVASFVVTVPPDRYFEVACATDPRLFRAENKHARRATNFTTSRMGGLLRAPAGQATYIIPPQQLRRFAGSQRLYYAVAAFRGARNEEPVLTLDDRLERTPSIQISPDFTGRSLDRGRIGKADARYGGDEGVAIGWGGDDVLVAKNPNPKKRIGQADPDLSTEIQADPSYDYDDGFDAALWSEEKEEEEGGETYAGRASRPEPYGYEDAAEMMSCGTEPGGYEDATSMPRAMPQAMPQAWGQASHTSMGAAYESDEGLGYEDAPDLERVFGSRARGSRAYGAPLPYAPPARPPAPPPPPPPMYMPPPMQTSMPVARYGGGPASQHHERYGSVTGGARPFVGDLSSAVYGGGEVDGYEDVPDLVRHLGPRARYGNGAALPSPIPPVVAPPPVPPPVAATAPNQFPDYSDDPDGAEQLPEGAPVLPSDEAFTPADPRHRLRILDRVALVESGSDRYRAVAGDDRVGAAIGYVKFAQRYGALGHFLRVCMRRDRDAYIRIFGEANAAPAADDFDPSALPAGNLLRVTLAADEAARLAPVVPPGGSAAVPLWQEPWLGLFRQAGDVVAFQEGQREVADRRFYLPYIDVLRWLGINSVRGHAMFVDRALQMGGGAAVRWIVRVAGPVQSRADLARALAHLGHADLRAFQAQPPEGVTLPAVDGVFGPFTHAALAASLRRRGDSPLPIRSEPDMLAALCTEAERQAASSPAWRAAAQRLKTLKDDPSLDRLPPEPTRGAA
jgi:hypothetical protein